MANNRLQFDGLEELKTALRNLPAELTGEASHIIESCSGHMSPDATRYNVFDGCPTHRKLTGQSHRAFSAGVRASDLPDVVVGQFVIAVIRAARKAFWMCLCAMSVAFGCSSFVGHIEQIVLRRAKKQVRRVHARRVVAAMTDEQSSWNLAVMQLPRETVGSQIFGVRPQTPVSLCVSMASPDPTVLCLFYISPEPIGWGARFGSRVTSVRAITIRASRSWRAAVFTSFGRLVGNHIDLLYRVARGAGRCSSTAAPRSLYRVAL